MDVQERNTIWTMQFVTLIVAVNYAIAFFVIRYTNPIVTFEAIWSTTIVARRRGRLLIVMMRGARTIVVIMMIQ